ncbi:sensor domain-containing diguanylate cyclase [Pseudoalteromonas carrageenovora]|uniref:diguanylate cyclase n=1 Tax=Pseudoalteromonas carrageenovora IAM 12662 TaxID=1314868 RepID=A0A2K4XF17_PSEVC|nr:diguanylate cyclase [Pseudoalteromonas carrageenovora]SOU42897.1 Diguanylate cyclase [Pseudoalteromonas carrageenovora IAM 12662]
MGFKSVEDTWSTIKLIPFAVVLYDAKKKTYKANSQAQSLFELSPHNNFDDVDFKHLTLTNPESKKQLIFRELFDKYLVINTSSNILLGKANTNSLINAKLAQLSDSVHIVTFEIIKQSEDEQYNFDKIISKISTDLIDIQSDEINTHIEFALKAIGTVCFADRSYLFKFSDDGKSMRNTHEWVNQGVEPFKDKLQHIPKNSLPYFTSLMNSTHLFKVNDVEKLPKKAIKEKEELQSEEIQSVLCIGLRYDKELVGFIGCDCVKQKRQWTDLDLIRLKLVGEMVANAFKNINFKNELQYIQQQLITANLKLNEQVNTDGLTDIANRRCFDDTLKNELLRCTRYQQPIGLIMCDIDFFKKYNDNYGHQQGDEVLKSVAQALKAMCKRQGDLAARYGGEEFAIILPATDTDNSLKFAALIQQKMAELAIEHNYSTVSKQLTISMGVYSLIPCKKTTAQSLISGADKALYDAKNTGRNQVALYK